MRLVSFVNHVESETSRVCSSLPKVIVMNYFALLLDTESELTEAGVADLMARYTAFESANSGALTAGDALLPAATGARIAGGPDAAVITDGPYVEGAEVAGGFYVLEADDLDAAIDVAKQIPVATEGAVELWPMVFSTPINTDEGPHWIALLREPADQTNVPGSPEWEATVELHRVFGDKYGSQLRGGGALHPTSSATTVRVRDGKVLVTDGPFVEGAEVANGYYVISAADVAGAAEIAAHIPASGVEVRGMMGMSLSA